MRHCVLFFVLLFGIFASPLYAQDRHIYWIGDVFLTDDVNHTIFRYGLDTDTVEIVAESRALYTGYSEYDRLPQFNSLAIDTLTNHIYWLASHWSDPIDRSVYPSAILRASLNGDDPEVFFERPTCENGTGVLMDIVVKEQTLFWSALGIACFPDVEIYESKLDAESVWTTLRADPTPDPFGVLSLALNDSMLFWAEIPQVTIVKNKGYGIFRAPLSNAMSDEQIIYGDVCDLALSHSLAKIYWSSCDSGAILRANLDGSEVEMLPGGTPGIKFLAIDDIGQKLYWSNRNGGTLNRSDLDGSNAEELLSVLDPPGNIALDFAGPPPPRTSIEEVAAFVALTTLYPNPATDRIAIEFVLAEPSHVTLEVYNLLGRRVGEIDSRSYLSGQFTVEWDMAGQPGGVYFVRMVSGRKALVRPFILQE